MHAEDGLRRWRALPDHGAWKVAAEDGALDSTHTSHTAAQARADALNKADQYAWIEARRQ